MKAIFCKSYGPPENLVLEEVDDLKPGEGEALVEVYAAALNFPDTLQIEGKYQWEHPFPFTPGSEAGGTIKELGPNVKGFDKGDRVVRHPPTYL
jgi:NADPH2:quinone reductase